MKGDSVYLTHILQAIDKIDSYVAVGRDVFMSTYHWQDAVVRQLEIIGEATKKRLTPEFRPPTASSRCSSGCSRR